MQYWIQEHNEWSTQQNEVFWRILKGWGFRSEDFKTGPPGRSSCLKRNSDCTFWTKERQRVAKESLAEMNARHKTDGPSVLRISMVSTCFKLVKFGDNLLLLLPVLQSDSLDCGIWGHEHQRDRVQPHQTIAARNSKPSMSEILQALSPQNWHIFWLSYWVCLKMGYTMVYPQWNSQKK